MKKLKLVTLALTPIIPIVATISCIKTHETDDEKAERIEQYSFTSSEHIVEKVSDRLTKIKIKITKPKAEVEAKDFAIIFKDITSENAYIMGSYFDEDYVVFEIKNIDPGDVFEVHKIVIGDNKHRRGFYVKYLNEKQFKVTIDSQSITPWGGNINYKSIYWPGEISKPGDSIFNPS